MTSEVVRGWLDPGLEAVSPFPSRIGSSPSSGLPNREVLHPDLVVEQIDMAGLNF